ncbi:anthranilate synthase component I family protein [Oceanobacillus alkalisoli]|uniref:anthranilate synthase component I family protein n=1 Tax=Oceanobacillus alkalisoli TaxID=2925113 RepID=UPI001EE414BD|nr:chorismate-binding protein [Oceanobacillus alkalisoli]MCG5102217.1 chorismate-binding protein [Oceanobacillus alkalisoli]
MSLTYRYEKIPAAGISALEIYKNVKTPKKFLLESTSYHEQKGKFTYLGINPYEEVIGKQGKTTVVDIKTNAIRQFHEQALDYLQKQLPDMEIHLPIPFFGGAVGYVGYDFICNLEGIPLPSEDELEMPDVHFMLFRNIIAFDHTKDCLYLIAINPEQNQDVNLEEELKSLKKMLHHNQEERNTAFPNVDFEPQETEASFKEKLLQAKEYINRGEVLQVVLSQRMQADISRNPDFHFAFYENLRRSNPSPYMFHIDFSDYILLGASPESLLQVTGNEVITNPIAGTRPRGATQAEDAKLETDLLEDEKELSEHRMLVDLSKEDLAKVCNQRTIELTTDMVIEKYQHVMHIVSELKGELQESVSSIDALISLLPAGTVSGMPKQRAMEIINELEEKMRGPYGGGVGYISFNRDLNIALTIRTLIIKEKIAYLQAGAGIVRDSVAKTEYEETLHKARSLVEAAYTFN